MSGYNIGTIIAELVGRSLTRIRSGLKVVIQGTLNELNNLTCDARCTIIRSNMYAVSKRSVGSHRDA